jgi:hypothetical protein
MVDEKKTDTEKYASYLLGDYDPKKVRLINEIRPADGFMVDNEFIWRIDDKQASRLPIGEMLTNLEPSGTVVIYMPAVDQLTAASIARKELKKHPEKRKTAIIF